MGRGVSGSFGALIDGIYIKSVDNFYVCQYIKYAYPGMIAYIAFIITIIVQMIILAIKYKSAIIKMCLIGIICYFVNLWWLDALQTLKFAYIIIAIFWAYVLTRQSEKEENINAAE